MKIEYIYGEITCSTCDGHGKICSCGSKLARGLFSLRCSAFNRLSPADKALQKDLHNSVTCTECNGSGKVPDPRNLCG